MKDIIYHEKVNSKKTAGLFLSLTILFLILFLWRVLAIGLDGLAIFLCVLFSIFLFYVINYRRLEIYLNAQILYLKFGLFHWRVPLENIAKISLDAISPLKRWGGAGIHFMFVDGRYRASFNLLEHPRVVIQFKKKIGPVRDLSFSTCSPDRLIDLITGSIESIHASNS